MTQTSRTLALLTLLIAFAQSPAQAQPPVRSSYDANLYQKDTTRSNNWIWVGGNERTIYNPLDGGVLLRYRTESVGNSDGCSGGAPREKALFLDAGLAHDANYDAPLGLARFPSYPNGGSIGQDISDYLFYKDIQFINNQARAGNGGFTNSINDTAADAFYAAVVVGGQFRGSSAGKQVLDTGGVIAVLNNGAYVLDLDVSWTAPDGSRKRANIRKPVGQTAIIPLSVNASNIEITASAVAGKQIFKRSQSQPGMYAFTVSGTTLINSVSVGLKNDLRNSANSTFKGREVAEEERAIVFSNQAGYVAEMFVTYFVNQNMGGAMVPMPKTLSSGKITAGISRSMVVPKDALPSMPIQVSVKGYGTTKGTVFSTTVPANFTGKRSYKAWGTIFNAQGGTN